MPSLSMSPISVDAHSRHTRVAKASPQTRTTMPRRRDFFVLRIFMVGYFSPWRHCGDRDPAGCRVQLFGFLDVNVGKSSMCGKKEADAEICGIPLAKNAPQHGDH